MLLVQKNEPRETPRIEAEESVTQWILETS
jgi:hypothetical protein